MRLFMMTGDAYRPQQKEFLRQKGGQQRSGFDTVQVEDP